ncbi:MAG TPA: guanylate kinase [Ruminococcus sp.]|nr:guanylate kinase [Ruminococcus sp.]
MPHLFYMMGKSASGKDSQYRKIIETLPLKPFVPYTTRPMRENEENGREYYFVTAADLAQMRENGSVIEERCYHTQKGEWCYFSSDAQIRLSEEDYIGIGTLESYEKLRRYFGEQTVVPLYIEVEDHTRLLRAIAREQEQEQPDYAEVCRRFLADAADFSEAKLEEAGITQRFQNIDFSACADALCRYIAERMQQA